jgi:transcriptional regulator with XRE-family HTH domain
VSGADLRAWRQAYGYSQAELAAELGVTRQTIIRWESAESLSRETHLAVAAVALLWQAPLPDPPR